MCHDLDVALVSVFVTVFRGIPINGQLEVSLDSDGCRSSPYSRVVYLEHVQAVVTLAASRRGEVEVFLTSPQGTRSTLLARRIRDASTEGFNAWAFMTTHCWGEIATGTWRLEVRNGASACKLPVVCRKLPYSTLLSFDAVGWMLKTDHKCSKTCNKT